MAAQSLVVYFTYGSRDLEALFALEEKLNEAIDAAGVGEFAGDEVSVDGTDAYLFFCGPDARGLFDVVGPILEQVPFMRGAEALLRYGDLDDGDVEEDLVIIGS
ncbi:MAG: hypothetical protein R3D33_05445 [Hyphomicrobiaceae bacterium]